MHHSATVLWASSSQFYLHDLNFTPIFFFFVPGKGGGKKSCWILCVFYIVAELSPMPLTKNNFFVLLHSWAETTVGWVIFSSSFFFFFSFYFTIRPHIVATAECCRHSIIIPFYIYRIQPICLSCFSPLFDIHSNASNMFLCITYAPYPLALLVSSSSGPKAAAAAAQERKKKFQIPFSLPHTAV